jgi:hypothetical protein
VPPPPIAAFFEACAESWPLLKSTSDRLDDMVMRTVMD